MKFTIKKFSSCLNQRDKNKKMGENGHVEYSWSSLQLGTFEEIKENILQIYFQLVRCNNDREKERFQSLKDKYRLALQSISLFLPNKNNTQTDKEFLLNVMYKLVAHTRDIHNGKGEYLLSYMMILVWHEIIGQQHAEQLLSSFVCGVNASCLGLGSWKDMKYFSLYCRDETGDSNHPLIQHCISLMNTQLYIDVGTEESKSSRCQSLVAKWIPRENSKKFGWLFEPLAKDYFSHYFSKATTVEAKTKALNKAKMNYRKTCSSLNKFLDTVQIKQCANTWSDIDYKHVTSITLSKQNSAFLNIKKDGTRRNEEDDRIVASYIFEKYIEERIQTGKEVNGKCVSLSDFVSRALKLLELEDEGPKQTQTNLLNSQWRDQSKETPALKNMVAMVDVSSSMNGLPLLTAIGLGCRIAEKSVLGKRVMTFSSTPTWVNLEETTNFVEMVSLIKHTHWGGNTNFYAALNMILEIFITVRVPPEDVENLSLVILSDMQIDEASSMDNDTLYGIMKKKYADAGKCAFGKPYNPPHIVFWNLRSTGGFPNVSTQKNTSMISGYNPSLLKLFCEDRESIQRLDPWTILMEILKPYETI